jgi:hypothetical protein
VVHKQDFQQEHLLVLAVLDLAVRALLDSPAAAVQSQVAVDQKAVVVVLLDMLVMVALADNPALA